MESSHSVGGTITFLALFQQIYTIAMESMVNTAFTAFIFHLHWNYLEQL